MTERLFTSEGEETQQASSAENLSPEAILACRGLHRVLLKTVPYPAFIQAKDGTYLDLNLLWARLCGKEPDEVIGRSDRDVLPASLAEQVEKHRQQAMETGSAVVFQSAMPGAFSHLLHLIQLEPVRNGSDPIIAFFGTVRQVSSQRPVEARSAEPRFRTFFEQSPLGIHVVDTDGYTLEVNDAWLRLWDAPPEAVKFFMLTRYNLLEDPQLKDWGFIPLLKRAFAGERVRFPPSFYDPARLGKPGRPRWIESLAYPVKDAEGRVREVVIAHSDVTERKLIEEQLHQAVKVRDEFLSIASHELKTPLTSLKLQAQMQKRLLDQQKPENADSNLPLRGAHAIAKQVDRLCLLVDEILDISIIAQGKMALSPRRVELGQLIHDVLERFRAQLHEAGIVCSFQLQGRIDCVCDRARMEQVLSNLMTNAMKYGRGQPIEILVRAEGGSAIIEIRDQGIGIASENQERIFNCFERAVSADNISGLGLGLYICRQIVEAHRGAISVQSELGHGSTFTVKLPLF